jgi:hypothetical protein
MRFVRIYHNPKDDPGSRIRVDYDPDDTGAFVVADENVLPEKTLDANCIRVQAVGNINLDLESARWLRDTMIALCGALDAEESELASKESP